MAGVEEKRSVTVEIAGSRYRMATDADPVHLERLAEAVNARIDALGPKATRTASPAQALAVVALALAEDLAEARARLTHLEERTQSTLDAAIERIDAHLGTAP
ncbi:MAG: cell division protein ZapA [Myxococcota bacterium]